MLVAQSCPTLCDLMDCSPPGSSVHEIFQARILEWVSISFSRGSSQPGDRTQVTCTAGRFFTEWATREAPIFLWAPFFGGGQDYWSGLPFPSPGYLPDSGMEPGSPALQPGSLPLNHQGSKHRNKYLQPWVTQNLRWDIKSTIDKRKNRWIGLIKIKKLVLFRMAPSRK